jgi:nucleoid-associated protein YgaU
MRTSSLLASLLLLAACDARPASRLVCADVVPEATVDCVVREARSTKRTWIARDGDSLRRIARRVYGDERLWKSIRDANPGRVAADGGVAAGAVLVIPFDGI